MNLIFSLCLKLSILHFCVSDLGYQCGWDALVDYTAVDPTIYLFNKDNTFNDDLNLKFKHACQNTYNIEEIYSLDDVSSTDYIVQLGATDYYDGKPLNGLLYAGDTNKNKNDTCHKISNTEPEFDCPEFVNLVGKSIETLNNGHLYEYIENMNNGPNNDCKRVFQDITDLTTVIICTDDDISHIHLTQPLKLKQVPRDLCLKRHYINNFDDRLLAVIAPTPFDVEDIEIVPTIFYETPYLTSEHKAVFPNSINQLPWRLLKYGFVKFVQKVGWRRFVILTDDSELSIDFEDELIELFNKEGMVYTAIRCEDAICDMNKIAKELQNVGAKIVIANVNENHMQKLLDKFDGHKMTWIGRDLPESVQTQHETVYSISLRAVKNTNCQMYDNILTGLSSISQTYENLHEEDFKASRRIFYRNFAKAMEKSSVELTEAEIIVKKLKKQEISRMKATSSGVVVTSFKNLYKTADGTGPCFALSYDYFHPCEDILVLILMFVILLFVTTILLISCYFEKTSPVNEFNYHNFR